MCGPGQQRAEHNRDQAIGRNAAHEDAQARNILIRGDDLEERRQRDKHQPETDGDAPDVPGAGGSGPKHHDASEQEERRRA